MDSGKCVPVYTHTHTRVQALGFHLYSCHFLASTVRRFLSFSCASTRQASLIFHLAQAPWGQPVNGLLISEALSLRRPLRCPLAAAMEPCGMFQSSLIGFRCFGPTASRQVSHSPQPARHYLYPPPELTGAQPGAHNTESLWSFSSFKPRQHANKVELRLNVIVSKGKETTDFPLLTVRSIWAVAQNLLCC